jgi:hypothetical protein
MHAVHYCDYVKGEFPKQNLADLNPFFRKLAVS